MTSEENKTIVKELIDLKKYKEELELAKQQYGGEEDLYPLVNILLRQTGCFNELSLRDVHRGQRNKVLYGLSGFPDLIVFNKEYNKEQEKDTQMNNIYGCVEIKKIDDLKEDEWVNKLKTDTEYEISIEKGIPFIEYAIKKEENKYFTQFNKYEVENINININDLKKDGFYYSEIIEINGLDDSDSIKDQFKDYKYIKFRKRREDKVCFGEHKFIINKKMAQILGEIFYYRKVIYTDGNIWDYFELGFDGEETEKDFRDEVNNIIDNKQDKVWYLALKDKMEKIFITYRRLANFKDISELSDFYNNINNIWKTEEIKN